MIGDLLLGLGLVAIVEGLVLALFPGRLRDLLAALEQLDGEACRLIGLIAVAVGVGLVWVARV